MHLIRLIGPLLLLCLLHASQASAQTQDFWTQPLRPCWVLDSRNLSNLTIASDNERIYIPERKGIIQALEKGSGRMLWRTELGGVFLNTPLVRDGLLWVVTATTHEDSEGSGTVSDDTQNTVSTIRLHLLNASDGTTRSVRDMHETSTDLTDRSYPVLMHGLHADTGGAILLQPSSGRVTRYDPAGNMLWTKNIGLKPVTAAVPQEHSVGFGTSDRTFLLLDPGTGTVTEQFNLGTTPTYVLRDTRGGLYTGDAGGVLSRLSDTGGVLWTFRTGGRVTSLKLFGERLLAVSDDNYIYMFEADSGDRIWKRKMAGRIVGSATLGENMLAVAALGSDILEILELERGRTVNRIFLNKETRTVSAPFSSEDVLYVPTDRGLQAFDPNCAN